MASVTTDDRWTRLVRDTLQQMQEQMEAREITVVFDGQRYVVRATNSRALEHGQSPVAAGEHDLLSAAPPAPRNHKGLLSPYTLADGQREVHVPFWAIARDHKYMVDLPVGACHGCAHGECAHGWPSAPSMHPASIVVLAVREGRTDCAHGWYVRLRGGNRLVEVPRSVRRALIRRMHDSELLRKSQLVRYNAWAHGNEDGFHEFACERFREYRHRVRAAVQESKKRNRCGNDEPNQGADACPEAEAASPPEPPSTCVVCLDDAVTSRARCREGTCGANVCDVCHADSRGLCPICDRSAINAAYPCGRCYEKTPLRQYGYECIGCDAHTLCKTCYTKFRECRSCESG